MRLCIRRRDWRWHGSFDAVFKHADIRVSFLTDAGDDEIFLGDKTDTGQFVVSEFIESGNGGKQLSSFGTTSEFCFCLFSAETEKHRPVGNRKVQIRGAKVNEAKDKLLRFLALKDCKIRKGRTGEPVRLIVRRCVLSCNLSAR